MSAVPLAHAAAGTTPTGSPGEAVQSPPDARSGMRSFGYRSWHESTLLSRQPRQDRECKGLRATLVNELSRCVPAWSCDIKGQGKALVAPPGSHQRKCGDLGGLTGADRESLESRP
jgi:hypothetical protein